MTGRFGKLRPETAAIALRLDHSPLRAFVYMVPSFKDGKRLQGRSREALEAWTEENAPGASPDDVQTVSFSIMELANDLYGGTKGSAQHAIRALTASGALVRISKGVRGHAALYAVMPPPEPP